MQRWRLTADGDVARTGHARDGRHVRGADAGRSAATARTARRPTRPRRATRLSVGKGHLEQGGRWTGWIEAGGHRKELGPNARGNRDKSWGPRRWGGPKMWRWFSINIDDDTHFGGIVIGTDGGDLHRGWVWRDGAPRVDRRVEGHERPRGRRRHPPAHATWSPPTRPGHDTSSRPRCSGSSRAARASSRRTTIVNEGLARWTYEGRTGTGISEYLHQLDDDARPVVPIT